MRWEILDTDALIQAALLGVVAFYLVMRIGAWMVFRPDGSARRWHHLG